MVTLLTVRDETTAGKVTREFTIEIPDEKIMVKDLIRERVYQEVQDYNHSSTGCFQGLIKPTDAEETFNGFKQKVRKEIDWKEQYKKALEAFETNRILILVDNKQAESLDEELTINSKMKVTFLRLTLLVGG